MCVCVSVRARVCVFEVQNYIKRQILFKLCGAESGFQRSNAVFCFTCLSEWFTNVACSTGWKTKHTDVQEEWHFKLITEYQRSDSLCHTMSPLSRN